jgi:hypothetical protein
MIDTRHRGQRSGHSSVGMGMKPSVECRKLAEVLREKAKTVEDAELRAEYQYLVRGFLRLATQFEQDMEAKKLPNQRSRKAAA